MNLKDIKLMNPGSEEQILHNLTHMGNILSISQGLKLEMLVIIVCEAHEDINQNIHLTSLLDGEALPPFCSASHFGSFQTGFFLGYLIEIIFTFFLVYCAYCLPICKPHYFRFFHSIY